MTNGPLLRHLVGVQLAPARPSVNTQQCSRHAVEDETAPLRKSRRSQADTGGLRVESNVS